MGAVVRLGVCLSHIPERRSKALMQSEFWCPPQVSSCDTITAGQQQVQSASDRLLDETFF